MRAGISGIRYGWSTTTSSGSSGGGVSPRIKKALKILGKRLPVEPDWKIRNAAWEELQGKELEDRILDLLERGDEIGALALVKTKYGYSTTEAKDFVDEMLR